MPNYMDETGLAELWGLVKAADNAVRELANGKLMAKTGSYVGTGTYGNDNWNAIRFNFNPVIVFVLQYMSAASVPGYGNNADTFLVLVQDGLFSCESNTAGYIHGNFATWANLNSAGQQLNESGKTYLYVALHT